MAGVIGPARGVKDIRGRVGSQAVEVGGLLKLLRPLEEALILLIRSVDVVPFLGQACG